MIPTVDKFIETVFTFRSDTNRVRETLQSAIPFCSQYLPSRHLFFIITNFVVLLSFLYKSLDHSNVKNFILYKRNSLKNYLVFFFAINFINVLVTIESIGEYSETNPLYVR